MIFLYRLFYVRLHKFRLMPWLKKLASASFDQLNIWYLFKQAKTVLLIFLFPHASSQRTYQTMLSNASSMLLLIYFLMKRVAETQQAGPALARAGPDWKHFCGAPLRGVCINVWRWHHFTTIEIVDVKGRSGAWSQFHPSSINFNGQRGNTQ